MRTRSRYTKEQVSEAIGRALASAPGTDAVVFSNEDFALFEGFITVGVDAVSRINGVRVYQDGMVPVGFIVPWDRHRWANAIKTGAVPIIAPAPPDPPLDFEPDGRLYAEFDETVGF